MAVVKLTDNVWWGDKASVDETVGQVLSVVNVAHSIRRPYWKNLQRLDWRVWYFRLACPDRVAIDGRYWSVFVATIDVIKSSGKLPLLCHCRQGGHRGPTSAFCAAMLMASVDGRQQIMDKVRSVKPGFFEPHRHRVYRTTMLEHLWNHLEA